MGLKPRVHHLQDSPADEPTVVVRILDAAANRAVEALRVAEDYVRFGLDDRALTETCKILRHDLSAALATIPRSDRLAARDVPGDVGTDVSTPREGDRPDLGSVVDANCQRLTEALRSLEEYGKRIDPQLGQRIEQLRYRAYTLDRSLGILRDARERLADARLYVLLDGRSSATEFEKLAAALVEGGVSIIQLRDKRLTDRELLSRARTLRKATAGTQTLFVTNDRPDLAVLASADGVHVGQEELSVAEVRKIVGPRMLIGVSTHSIEQARQAVADGAQCIGIGPVFPSGTKTFAAFPGLDFVRQVADEIRLPAYAIGGITLENLPSLLAAGATHVAVQSAIIDAADPCQAAGEFGRLLQRREASGG